MGEETSEVSEGLGDFKEDRSITAPEALAVGRLVVDFVDGPAEHTQPDLAPQIVDDTVTSLTGQLRWQVTGPERGFITIDTPGTQAAVGSHTGEPQALEQVTITPSAQLAAIYVSALGPSDSLVDGEEALLTAVARVHNTGMRVDADGDELLELGGAPMRCEPVRAELRFARALAAVEVLDHGGLPTGRQIELDDPHTLTIDGARDRTLYYRVVFE